MVADEKQEPVVGRPQAPVTFNTKIHPHHLSVREVVEPHVVRSAVFDADFQHQTQPVTVFPKCLIVEITESMVGLVGTVLQCEFMQNTHCASLPYLP